MGCRTTVIVACPRPLNTEAWLLCVSPSSNLFSAVIWCGDGGARARACVRACRCVCVCMCGGVGCGGVWYTGKIGLQAEGWDTAQTLGLRQAMYRYQAACESGSGGAAGFQGTGAHRSTSWRFSFVWVGACYSCTFLYRAFSVSPSLLTRIVSPRIDSSLCG